MKLINKTQRIYLILTVGLLLLWSVLFLFAISWAIEENIDETLHSELISMINQSKATGTIQPISTQQMEIIPISAVPDNTVSFSDTTIYNLVEHEPFPYRQISIQTQINGEAYQIIFRRSMVEYDDLFETILVMELIFVLLLLGGLFITNKKILQRLWRPFHDTMQQVTDFKMGQGNELQWPETKIDEFRQLNRVLKKMIQQVEQEYESLKQFTENASHEIQTPLSVISNKTEILLQEESWTQEQGKNISTIHRTAGKLSRLNKALLMLAKIENEQFRAKQDINISQLLEGLIPDYKTLARSKNISFQQEIEPAVQLSINRELAELMFRNLLGNAIKHNHVHGRINLRLNHNRLIISNTGAFLTRNGRIFFERFKKGEDSMESLGLGLSIVAAIVKSNGLRIDYCIKENVHEIVIGFMTL